MEGAAGGRRRKGPTRAPPVRGGVLPQFLPVDVTDVEAESEALAGCLLYFCDYGDLSKADVEVMVKRHQGRVSRARERLGGEGWRVREMCLLATVGLVPQCPKSLKTRSLRTSFANISCMPVSCPVCPNTK